MSPFRLIVDPPKSGAWNMSADEYLLQSADQTGLRTLRFYRWSEPTLSLGYFQSHADRVRHSASADCALVRRNSGGGAILHDHELTYSLTLPVRDRLSRDAERLYATLHETLIEVLARVHTVCQLHTGATTDNAFLCFQRRAGRDVILNQQKIMGSAQRRTKNGMLQHGSLLLRRSRFAPELAGIEDLTERPLDSTEIIREWTTLLAHRFSTRFSEDILGPDEADAIKSLASRKYSAADWTFRR